MNLHEFKSTLKSTLKSTRLAIVFKVDFEDGEVKKFRRFQRICPLGLRFRVQSWMIFIIFLRMKIFTEMDHRRTRFLLESDTFQRYSIVSTGERPYAVWIVIFWVKNGEKCTSCAHYDYMHLNMNCIADTGTRRQSHFNILFAELISMRPGNKTFFSNIFS